MVGRKSKGKHWTTQMRLPFKYRSFFQKVQGTCGHKNREITFQEVLDICANDTQVLAKLVKRAKKLKK